ncbi:hypothetical protein AVEN_181922-1 [Araneus ventricosus]|uniref:Uncharacterized protein n=1 Tax=Araneus ventricosus TaxID=182803 RepID=A0A4Y2WIK9_ARAVE|nr:hypothetical protein AVEN_181922-1 [Araneus ventricosus]
MWLPFFSPNAFSVLLFGSFLPKFPLYLLVIKPRSRGLFDLQYLYGLKKDMIDWCMEMNMNTKEYVCLTCGMKMVLTERNGSDGYSWVCIKFGVNAHHVRRTARKGSWFDESKLNIPEILILTYLRAVATHFK